MRRSKAAMNHEVRLRAAAWARRLVEQHGVEAEAVVRATLRRPELTEYERLAARFTRDALLDLRRLQGQARPVPPPKRRGIGYRVASLLTFGAMRRSRAAASQLSHQ